MIDLDLERTILGSMCMETDSLTNGMARLKKEYFSDKLHQAVFDLMKSMYDAGKCVDIVTVAKEGSVLLKQHGVSWLLIKDSYISTGAFDFLMDKLEKYYQLRKLHELAGKIVDKVNDREEPDGIIQEIESSLYNVSSTQKTNLTTPKEHARRMIDTLEKRLEQKNNGGIYTTYYDLNKALNGGFEPGQLIIVAAQTGKGKTAFAMNLMRDIAIMQKIPSLYVNTEMSEEQMDIRWMTLLSRINHYNVATGNLTDEQTGNIMMSLEKMNSSGFYSVFEDSLTLNKLISICRRFSAQKQCRFIVVDYIGRMETLDPKLQEWQVLKNAAKRLKTIAQETKTTVLMLAQVNEDDRLEGARGMKNEADMYGYLRPLSEEEKKGQDLIGFNYCLSVEKNRSGATKKIPLIFYGTELTFEGRKIRA